MWFFVLVQIYSPLSQYIVCCNSLILSSAYLSEDGKTKVNMFFKGDDLIQITKLRIKVRACRQETI